jgi:hypothetical protein
MAREMALKNIRPSSEGLGMESSGKAGRGGFRLRGFAVFCSPAPCKEQAADRSPDSIFRCFCFICDSHGFFGGVLQPPADERSRRFGTKSTAVSFPNPMTLLPLVAMRN